MVVEFHDFTIFFRLCGFDSAFTIESIQEEDIEKLNEFGRTILSKIKGEGEKQLTADQMAAVVGCYYNNPQNFQIECGEKALLRKIVKYAANKIQQNGCSYFAVENLGDQKGENSKRKNWFFLEARKKYLFMENESKIKTNLENGALKKSKGVRNAAVTAISNYVPASEPSNGPIVVHESQSNNNLPFCEQSPSQSAGPSPESILKVQLIERVDKLLHRPDSQITATFAETIQNNMRNITVNIVNDIGSKTAIISCFCGSKCTIKYVLSKIAGYWKYWNWDRHIKCHVQIKVNPNGKQNLLYLR